MFVHEYSNALVARSREAEAIGLGSEPSTGLGDRDAWIVDSLERSK